MFGNKLKEILEVKNISQKKMAEDLNISQNSITNWIKNKSKPTKENINKISEYLKVNTEYWNEKEEKIKNINYGNYSKNGDTYNNNNNKELPYITLAIIEELKKIPEEEQADLFKALKSKEKNKNKM